MTIKIFHDQSPRTNVARLQCRLNLQPDYQSDMHPTEPLRPAHNRVPDTGDVQIDLVLCSSHIG